MCKPKRNILCYSWYEFRKIMQHNNWVDSLSENYCAISICTSGEGECSEHWFKNDCHNSQNLSVFNLDVDDSGLKTMNQEDMMNLLICICLAKSSKPMHISLIRMCQEKTENILTYSMFLIMKKHLT